MVRLQEMRREVEKDFPSSHLSFAVLEGDCFFETDHQPLVLGSSWRELSLSPFSVGTTRLTAGTGLALGLPTLGGNRFVNKSLFKLWF